MTSILDCGDFTKFDGPEYWKDPNIGLPPPHRPKMSTIAALARLFFPNEAKRVDEIHKRDLAARKATVAASAEEKGEETSVIEQPGERGVVPTKSTVSDAVAEAIPDNDTGKKDGTEPAKSAS